MATNTFEFLEYNSGLKKKIQKLFIEKIVPANFVMMIPKYSSKVLTDTDIARIRKKMERSIDQDVNMDLLDLMARYEGWFECLIKCLGDSELKQSYLIQAFQQLKREFDEEYKRVKSISQFQTDESKFLYEPNRNEIEGDFVLPLKRDQHSTVAERFEGSSAVAQPDYTDKPLRSFGFYNTDHNRVQSNGQRAERKLLDEQIEHEAIETDFFPHTRYQHSTVAERFGGSSAAAQPDYTDKPLRSFGFYNTDHNRVQSNGQRAECKLLDEPNEYELIGTYFFPHLRHEHSTSAELYGGSSSVTKPYNTDKH